MIKPIKDKLEHARIKLKEVQNDYEKCKVYFKQKGVSDEKYDEDDYCGYFKEMISYWTNRINTLEKDQT